jgi:hypothetical protein
MAFIVENVPEITVNVDIKVPGEVEVSRIQATWVLHDFDEFKQMNEKVASGEITDEQLVESDLKNAAPFFDKGNNEIKFSPELVAGLMKKTYFRQPLIRSWWDAQMCRNEASEKN